MAQQEGPFSEYLQQAKLAPPMEVPKPTGLEGTGASIANVAMNFLQGLRQGRAQKYMQKELEESRKEQMLATALSTLYKSEMNPEARKRHEAAIHGELAKRVAGVKETSKDTGNPLTDFFKQLGSGLIGGQPVGGKKADIDLNVAMNAFAAAADPRNSIAYELEHLNSQVADAVSKIRKGREVKGEPVSSLDILEDPVVKAARARATMLGKPLAALQDYLRETSGYDQSLLRSQRAQIAAQNLRLPQPGEDIESYAATQAPIAKQANMPFSIGQEERFIDPSTNEIVVGKRIQHPSFTGVWNTGTNQLQKNLVKPTPQELGRLNPEIVKRETNKAIESINVIFGEDSSSAKIFTNQLGGLNDINKIHDVVNKALAQNARSIANDYKQKSLDLQTSRFKLTEKKFQEQESENQKAIALRVQQQVGQAPTVKAFDQVDSQFRALQGVQAVLEKLKKEKKPLPPALVNDYQKQLISFTAKAIDPMSSIKSNELSFWGDATKGLDRIQKLYDSIKQGIAVVMIPDEEAALTTLAQSIYSNMQASALRTRKRYADTLISLDVPEEKAYVWTGYKTLSAPRPPQQATAPIPTQPTPLASPTSPTPSGPRPGYNPKAGFGYNPQAGR